MDIDEDTRASQESNAMDNEDDEDSLVDCLMESDENPEESEEDNMETGAADTTSVAPVPRGRLSPSDVIARQLDDDDEGLSPYLKMGFRNIPEELRNLGMRKFQRLSLELFDEERFYNLLRPAKRHERTMDSFSKAFSLVPFGDDSNYNQPPEGTPFYFLAECNSMTLPRQIEDVLFFFYTLQTYIKQNGVTNHVLRSDRLMLEQSRTRDKVTSGVLESKLDMMSDAPVEHRDGDRSFNVASDVFQERIRQGTGDHLEEKDLFTIRVAYTGAVYEVAGELKQMLFCMAIVTPLKNFDFLGYINFVFLNAPRIPAQKEHWKELCGIWRHIMMTEANENCGLMGDPTAYKVNPGGVLGAFTLLNMLNIPYRIYNKVKKASKHATRISIIGCPRLHFSNDGVDEPYLLYFHTCVNKIDEAYQQLSRDIRLSLSMKENERQEKEWDIVNIGGWPLKTVQEPDGGTVFQRFGHFPWPIMLRFSIMKPMGENINKKNFMLNLGNLPLTVQKMLQDFKTFDPNAASSVAIPDEHILKSTEEATPLKVFEAYYGSERNVEDLKDTKLAKWFDAFKRHIYDARTNGYMTPAEAMVQVHTHMRNCMRLHMDMLRGDGYGSEFFKQCIHIIDNVGKTDLKTVSLKAYLDMSARHRVQKRLAHNAFVRNSLSLMQHLCDLNEDMKLNALNLEAMQDIMISSIHWHIGSHSHSFIAFFQCVMIASCVGHLDMNIEKDTMQMEWRKPNSSGAGLTQGSIIRYYEHLGKLYLIMLENNKLVLFTWNRTTKVAFESECCVTYIKDQRVAEPSHDFKFLSYAYTENRKKDTPWETLIQIGFPRDGVKSAVIMSTADTTQTGVRELTAKVPITNVHIEVYSTNEPPPPGDVPQTLYVVMHAVDPGTDAYKKPGDAENTFNSGGTELGQGRPDMEEDHKGLLLSLKHIFFSNILARTLVAKAHNSGIFPYEVNKITNCYLDWFYAALKHVYCLMNTRVLSNFGRIKYGYESREIAWSVWVNTVVAYANSEGDPVKAGIDATLACAFDPIPISQVASIVHYIFRRGFHGGLLSLAGCFIQAFRVPIVLVDDLCDFFKSDEVDETTKDEVQDEKETPGMERTMSTSPVPPGENLVLVANDPIVSDQDERIVLDVQSDEDAMCGSAQRSFGEMSVDDAKECWSSMMEDRDPPSEQERAALMKRPLTPPPLPDSEVRLRDLQGKYVQLKDVVDRLEMIFNQSMGRVDDQLSNLTSHQKRNANGIAEVRGVIQALVAEAGEDRVQARMHEASQSMQARGYAQFGGDFGQGGGYYRQRQAAGGWDMIPPAQTQRHRSYEAIKRWVQWLVENNCFCPEDANRPFCLDGNVKCYISSPGNAEGGIENDRTVKRILRMFPSERGSRTIDIYVAHLIYMWYGDQLKKYCHISNEPSIMQHLIRHVSGMELDLRVIMDSSPVFDTAKHIKKLGLHRVISGLAAEGSDKPDRFMREFTWKSQNNAIMSEGMGVNMWQLLVLASLIGNDSIHCKSRSRVSQSVLRQILKMAPSAATPGNLVSVRSFHERSNEPEFVLVPDAGRCEHFLRPIYDDGFALNGVPSYCAPVNGKMPEDYLGVSGVLAMANFLQCHYAEVPPKSVCCHYNLVPYRYHHVCRGSDVEGNIYLDDDGVRLAYDDGAVEQWDLVEWEDKLKDREMLVMPTIWRSGTLVVCRDGATVGSLVNFGTRKSIEEADGDDAASLRGFVSNYDHHKFCYHLLVAENSLSAVSVRYVLDNLVTPGTEVWIRGDTQPWEDLREFLPDADDMGEEQADQRMIRARLNVPLIKDPQPGIIYLTVLQKPRNSGFSHDSTYRHVTASPWEISPVPPAEPRMRITELLI